MAFWADGIFRWFYGAFGWCCFSFFVFNPNTMNFTWTNILPYPEFNEESEFHIGFTQKCVFDDFPIFEKSVRIFLKNVRRLFVCCSIFEYCTWKIWMNYLKFRTDLEFHIGFAPKNDFDDFPIFWRRFFFGGGGSEECA